MTEVVDHPVVRRVPWIDVLGSWAIARLVVAGGFAVAEGAASRFPKGVAVPRLDQRLLTWDGGWYRTIAEHGYTAGPGLRFFPLYPMLARVLSFGGRADWALLLIANGAALACGVLLWRLVVEHFDDEPLARRAVWILALFPSAGALVFAYGESLMLALTLGAFLLIRRDRWWLASAAAVLAGTCRPVALLLCLPFGIEAARSWRSSDRAGRLSRVATVLAPAVGSVGYLSWVGWRFGDATLPLDEQRRIRDGFVDPVSRTWRAVREVFTTSQLNAPSLAFAVLFGVMLVIAVRRQPTSWWLYGALSLTVALSSPVIDSLGRYGLIAPTFVIAIAQVTGDERSFRAWLAVSSAALCGLTAMTLIGPYVL